MLLAEGSSYRNPEVNYYRALREPGKITEDVSQTFLGVRFNCNKCHDHPFEKWTQRQYYEFGAYFARVAIKRGSLGKEPGPGWRRQGKKEGSCSVAAGRGRAGRGARHAAVRHRPLQRAYVAEWDPRDPKPASERKTPAPPAADRACRAGGRMRSQYCACQVADPGRVPRL